MDSGPAVVRNGRFDESDGADGDQQADYGDNDFGEDMDAANNNGSEQEEVEDDDDDDADLIDDEIGAGYSSLPQSFYAPQYSNSPGSLQPLPSFLVGNDPANAPLPPHLKDISSLAAWTVSTHKPGCGVAALLHPSPNYFWQSDGPQPHHLNIHFFKLVSIAHIRVYLDYVQDESYTPTKLHFLAGTGHHDLQDVCIMTFSQPKGWLDVDLSNAGGPNAFEDGELDDEATGDDPRLQKSKKKKLPGHGPTLRCRLVQLRILENHQNGKDTHLRGLQIFAVDESAVRIRRRKRPSVKASESAPLPSFKGATTASLGSDMTANQHTEQQVQPAPPTRPSNNLFEAGEVGSATRRRNRASKKSRSPTTPLLGLREPDWMGEPVLR